MTERNSNELPANGHREPNGTLLIPIIFFALALMAFAAAKRDIPKPAGVFSGHKLVDTIIQKPR